MNFVLPYRPVSDTVTVRLILGDFIAQSHDFPSGKLNNEQHFPARMFCVWCELGHSLSLAWSVSSSTRLYSLLLTLFLHYLLVFLKFSLSSQAFQESLDRTEGEEAKTGMDKFTCFCLCEFLMRFVERIIEFRGGEAAGFSLSLCFRLYCKTITLITLCIVCGGSLQLLS